MLDKTIMMDAIKKYEPEMVKFARDLVAIPGYSGSEGKVARRIADEMKKARFDSVKIDRMGNVLGFLGNGPKKIMFDAHIDTVGVGDPKAWKWDPFKGRLEKGVIYGRGATDQKLSMVSIVYAARLIKEMRLEGGYTFIACGSCMEEDCDGLPLLHVIKSERIKPDYVVLTEPTDLQVYRGHRGRMEIKVVTKGRSCHASAPERGDNAVVKMAPVIEEITALNKKLRDDKFLGKGTVAVTCIECKTPSYNAVPDECTVYLDRRLTKGETLETSLREVRALPSVKTSGAKVEVLQYNAAAWTGLKVGQEKYFPTWTLPENHELVKAALRAAQLVHGRPQRAGKWVFSTNGVASAGRLGIPTIGFGPSDEIYAHTVNEQMKVGDLLKAAVFYAALPEYLIVEKSL
ncbi:MAG: YgeY family selenium metabolism-linked hydrolase [Elusimicrobiales bacterium]|nr:YgeY family selenium metabolism-linked hydrolase [Elusimicrobiales bacterium]